MDITEIIPHQHAEQRRMFSILEEWPRDDVDGLGAVWEQLAILLETHADAEERYFYPELLKLGTGAGDAASAGAEVEDSVEDHNELRDAIRRVRDAEVGSTEWWTAVTDANVANSGHMGEEERRDLADFRQRADLALRHEIAVAFYRHQAQNASGVPLRNKDPEKYVKKHENAPTTPLATKAAENSVVDADEPATKDPAKQASETE